MDKKNQPVRNSHTNKISNKTVYNVTPSSDPNTPTMDNGEVKYGRHTKKVYYSDLTKRWCNY